MGLPKIQNLLGRKSQRPRKRGPTPEPYSLSPSPTGVSAGTYGNSTHVAQTTVDIAGRVTSITNVAISGGTGIMTIGDPVTSGSTNCILFVDSSHNLAQSAYLGYNSAGCELNLGSDGTHPGKITLGTRIGGGVSLAAPYTSPGVTYLLPGSDGTTGQTLTTDGSGNLSWATAGGAAGMAGDIQTNSGSGGFATLGYAFSGTSGQTYTLPGSSDTLIGNLDSRLSDSRSPTAHASTHSPGASDPIGNTNYTVGSSGNWSGSPNDVWAALDRIAAVLTANSMTP